MKKRIYSYIALVIIILFVAFLSSKEKQNPELAERVKISLREVGNQLLLANKDSISLILPVTALEHSKYNLSFEDSVAFEPGHLVKTVSNVFQKSGLSSNYIVEVIQCEDGEVAYSYSKNTDEEKTIIPCQGRVLPEACYTLEVAFEKKNTSFSLETVGFYILIFIFLALLLEFLWFRKKTKITVTEADIDYEPIGSFHFFPNQNKLVKAAQEISLSKKECELLSIFIERPNQVIKRDELTKMVWEDHGVFVGRSLDTYISKLRKKLKSDDNVKLINVHGVGYKLELN